MMTIHFYHKYIGHRMPAIEFIVGVVIKRLDGSSVEQRLGMVASWGVLPVSGRASGTKNERFMTGQCDLPR